MKGKTNHKPRKLVLPPGTKPPEVPPDRPRIVREPIPSRGIVSSDVHFPIEDKRVNAAKLAFARDFKPDVWIELGDLYDLWSVSRFPKEADRWQSVGGRLQEEFDAAQDYWEAICTLVPKVHYVLGNHERRLADLIDANPGLLGLRALGWKRLAGIPDMVNVYPYGTRLNIGGLWFEHGDRIRGAKHHADWALANRLGQSTTFGHYHQIESRHRSVMTEGGYKSYGAHGLGHGSDVEKQRYVCPAAEAPDASWQHGFGAIRWWLAGGKPRFRFDHMPVINGVLMGLDGTVYDGRQEVRS